ncbi:MAG: hypothetical protein PHF35_05190 [Candidatus Moranbacteria bacterium]|nr:hypothetical protein [Candidatus Moranbacteria bacterium]
MPKKIIIIIVVIVAAIALGAGAFLLVRGRTSKPSATPAPSESPTDSIFASPSSGSDLFPTSSPETNKSALICASLTGSASELDSDNDGLSDGVEAIYETDPGNPDTDGDGYKDGEEVLNGYDPLVAGSARLDSDDDGLLDYEECKWGTDIFVADTDGDSYNDYEEINNGYDPLIAGSARLGSTVTTTPTPVSSIPTVSPTTAPTAYTSGTVKVPIDRSEIIVTSKNSAADVKAYLNAIDQNSSVLQDLTSGTAFSDALVAAIKGDSTLLRSIVSRLQSHEQSLLKVQTPEKAVSHQAMLVGIVRFVNVKLEEIASKAGSQTAQLAAAMELQQKLPSYLSQLNSLRQQLDQISQ